MSRPMQVIICGAPASGKGTQCELIAKNYGLVHISTGDILRANVKQGTDVGKKAKGFMDAGKLVPDELVIDMVKDRLAQTDCKLNGWLLDGFPRTKLQAEALQAAGLIPDCLISLEVPDDVLIERVCGRRLDPVTGKIYHMKFYPPPKQIVKRLIHRSDDSVEKITPRLESFHKYASDIETIYRNVRYFVNGDQEKMLVFAEIVRAIETMKAKKKAAKLRAKL